MIHELVHSFYLLYSTPLWLRLHFCSPVGRHWSCFQFLLLLLQKPWRDILIRVSLCTSVRIPLESHLEVELPSSKGNVCFQLYQILPNCPLKQLCPILHEFLLLRAVKWELFLDIFALSHELTWISSFSHLWTTHVSSSGNDLPISSIHFPVGSVCVSFSYWL